MIGSIVSACMRLRTLVVVIALIVMTVGIIRLDDMPVDVFPEILPVTVHVQTEALGLSAEEVEQLITVPLEADLLAGTPWADDMRSESVPGLSSIDLTFKPGTNPMDARQVVQERLTQAHANPNVGQPPLMLNPLSSTNRVMIIGLSSKNQSLIEMSVLARWTIRPRLMGVPGVANVSIWGQRERQLQVQVDPKRLREKRIPLIDIVKTAGNSLWYSPLTFLEASVAGTGGFVETPNQRLGVRHVLPIATAEDLSKVPVEGTSIPLDQVASVVEDHQLLIGDAMNAAGSTLFLVVEKLPGVNTLEVSDHILEAIEALKPGLGGIEFNPKVYQPASYIRASIGNVERALMVALGLILVLMLALSHSWRAALIGLIAIPLSVTAAVLVIYRSGATVNAMVVSGLMIALGIIIDDAIVYSHSLLRRLREGPGESVFRTLFGALAEVRGPMIFATAIVLLSAVPALFMAGTSGALIQPVVTSFALAVAASFIVAMTVTPALGMLLLQKAAPAPQDNGFSRRLKGLAGGMSAALPRVAIGLVVVAGVAAIVILQRIDVPAVPDFKEPDLLVQWDAAPGTSRMAMNRMIDRVSRELRSIPGVHNVGAHVGRAIASDQVVGMNSGEMWVNLDPRADYDRVVSSVEDVVDGYPGVNGNVTTFLRSRFAEPLSGVDEPIVVRLYGQEQDVLRAEGQKLLQSLASIQGLEEPRLEAESQEPVVEIEVDLAAANSYGVKPGDVRRTAATLLSGLLVGNLFEEQKIFEVVVWGTPEVRHSVAGINDLLIDTPSGGQARLGDVASVRIRPAPTVIRRENVARTLNIVAGVNGRSVNAVSADVRSRIQNTSFPLEYRAELLGDFARQQAAWQRVALVILGVAIGIVFILQAAFGSWALALTVGLTLPLAMGGSILAAAALGPGLSLAALGGILTVLGITARQTVLLVSRYRWLRTHEGMSFGPDLVQKGLLDQVTPIVMTALVTAGAVVPFAVFGNRPGLEVVGPLATVILGGLVTATLYSLSMVPALYARFGENAMPDAVDEDDLEDRGLNSIPVRSS